MNKSDANVYGTVVSSGPGYYDANGKLIPVGLNAGDKVMLPEFGGRKSNSDNKTFSFTGRQM